MIQEVTTVERLFRRLINRELLRLHGTKYWRRVIPADIKQKVQLRIDKHLSKSPHLGADEFRAPERRLEYCDVPDYRKIFSGKLTRDVFKPYFPSAEHFDAQLVFFSDYRNAVMHDRQLDPFSSALGLSATQMLLAVLRRIFEDEEGEASLDREPATVDTQTIDGSSVSPPAPGSAAEVEGLASSVAEPESPYEAVPVAEPGPDEPTTDATSSDQSAKADVPVTEPDASMVLIDPDALPKHLNKVWRKLAKFYDVSTVEGVAVVDPEEFGKRPGVGQTYVDGLRELRECLEQAVSADASGSGTVVAREPERVVHLGAEYYLSWIALSEEDREALRKVRSVFGLRDRLTANKLLELGYRGFDKHQGVGEHSVRKLRALLEKIEREAERLQAEDEIVGLHGGSILVPLAADGLALSDVESLLLEIIRRFLALAPAEEARVLPPRWGYGMQRQTLEEVGAGLPEKRTRERIRQIQADAERHFQKSLPVPPEVIRRVIEEHLHSDLSQSMPMLFSSFDRLLSFQSFLAMATGSSKEWLAKAQRARSERFGLLDEYFAARRSPVPYEQLLDFLCEQEGWTGSHASHSLQDLARQGRLELKGGCIAPRGMNKGPALAHVLFMHPAGLSWKDAAIAVNDGGYSARHLSTERPDGELTRSADICLAGRGYYRHVAHLGLTDALVTQVLTALRDYLETQAEQTSNIQSAHGACWPSGEIDYYTVRYVCRTFGENDGIHGTYQSSADTISLRQDHRTRPTHEHVYTMLAEAVEPMPLDDVRRQLRTKTSGWAALLLDRLVNDGRIVEVNSGRYLTTEMALRSAESNGVASATAAASALLGNAARVSDVRDLVNEETGGSFTRSYIREVLEAARS